MGRSIVRNPKVFLFDDPLSNLDAKLRGATRREILLLHKRLGATVVCDGDTILGIITDGDLRRMLMNTTDIEHVKASQIMTTDPKTIDEEALVVDALHKMRENSITQLPVLGGGKYLGIIHLHDILKEGIF